MAFQIKIFKHYVSALVMMVTVKKFDLQEFRNDILLNKRESGTSFLILILGALRSPSLLYDKMIL